MKLRLNTNFHSALIGYTGFVGSNLMRQAGFTHTFNSTNFKEMAGCGFDVVVCAGVSAAKYLANRDPVNDLRQIERLQEVLTSVRAGVFVLVSTIDAYHRPEQVVESDIPVLAGHHPYGVHRYLFERFVLNTFSNTMIFRLPGVFGPGLKKNVLFDLMHRERLSEIHPEGQFQWYPIDRLWHDIDRAADAGIDLLNLAVEPMVTSELVQRLFPDVRLDTKYSDPPRYDMWTSHAEALGGSGNYLMNKGDVFSHLAGFVSGQPSSTSVFGKSGY